MSLVIAPQSGFRFCGQTKIIFTDKSPFTTLEQLHEARQVVRKTGRKHMYYYSERIHTEAGYYAGELILDVLNRTENAMTQKHCFKATELALADECNA